MKMFQASWPIDDNKGWPLPSDGPAERCVGGGDWQPYGGTISPDYPLFSYINFDLPVSSNTLYLLARGSLAHGDVTIIDSQDGGDIVKVEVIVSYHTQEALDRANVCLLERKTGENGIGIFVSHLFYVFI